jgi:hypothetical protein
MSSGLYQQNCISSKEMGNLIPLSLGLKEKRGGYK